MSETPAPRDARAEAQAALGDDLEARVLEPSGPVPGRGALTWDDWLRERPPRAAWAAERWLGAYRRLEPPPATLAETRESPHRIAVYVVSPARRPANGSAGDAAA